MDKKTQLFFRIASPIVVGVVFFYLALSSSYEDAYAKIASSSFEIGKLTVPAILSFVVGFIIHQYIRPMLLNGLWTEIDFAVKQKLVKIAGLGDQDAYKLLSAKKRLIRVFFKLIDSDESLKNTSDKVRLNGLVITTLADIKIFSSLSILLILGKELFGKPSVTWDLCIVVFCCICLFISEKLLICHKKKHIEMGAEQLSELSAHHKPKVEEKIKELLQDLPKNA